MINTLADLLNELKNAEAEKIESRGIKHRPTIGNVYEGLTAELLNMSLFEGYDLNVVRNSFILTDKGERSSEFDVMLIQGKGEELPYSQGQFDVRMDQVIAVIQVKKKLNKAQIEEAFYNLRNVYEVSDFNHYSKSGLKLFTDAYKSICHQHAIVGNQFRKTFKSVTEEYLFHLLKLESYMPARIAFGYEGYTTESGFREGFIKFIEENKSDPENLKYGFGPLNYPDLIINGEFSLIKGNGMPYIGNFDNFQWQFYFSSGSNPIYKLLEIIWTRLAYRFKLSSDIFGDDLFLEPANLLLKTNLVNFAGKRGWNFEYMPLSEKLLSQNVESKEWEPTYPTEDQYTILVYLCNHGKLRRTNIHELVDWDKVGYKLDEFIEEFVCTGLVSYERGELMLLTEQCQCMIVPRKGYVAADNKTGQLTRWLKKNYGDIKHAIYVQ